MREMSSFKELLLEMERFGRSNKIPIINEKGMPVLIETVAKARPHRILEIGTAIGYSALLLVSSGAEDAEVVSLELSEERAAQARGYIGRSPYKDRINVLVGDAGELLYQLKGPFDFVFIDAAKGQYPDYLKKIQPLLTADATVVADNVLFRGYVLGSEECPRRFKTIVKRLRQYIDMVSDSEKFSTIIREDGDGLAISRRVVSSSGECANE